MASLNSRALPAQELLSTLPAAPTLDAATVRAARATARPPVLIVLDDDPTGTQSVSNLPVLTRWEVADLEWGLRQETNGEPVAALYVLTNTRSLGEAEAAARNTEIATAALAAAANLGVRVDFVSRGDSTLRGHYPLEPDTLAAAITADGGAPIDGVLIAPGFPDAGRITVDSTHYCVIDGIAIPAAETEFAADATFGYTSSHLADYVQEKSGGRIRSADVLAVTLDTIRNGGPEAVAGILLRASNATPIVIDFVVEEDLRVVALGLLIAQGQGRTFLHRVGPPFVRAIIGQDQAAPLTADDVYAGLTPSGHGGLIVVGSHVGVTTRQLARLKEASPETATVELEVPSLVTATGADHPDRAAHLAATVAAICAALATGNVILQTSRALVTTADAQSSLALSRSVSAAVVSAVQQVLGSTAPRFVIAKGGITSSDVAAFGLSIRHAIVRGPMLPGIVSLWEPQDGPATGIPYVVFAGNVGTDDSLAQVAAKLSA